MKKFYSTIIGLLFIGGGAVAQDKDPVSLDLLKAPSSPAAQLLGFAVSEIEKPTDLKSFMLSIQSASSTFSKLPNSFAVDLAPFSLIAGKGGIPINGIYSLQSTDLISVIKQTMVASIAFRNPDTAVGNFLPKNSYAAFGLKFSIKRPEYSVTNKTLLKEIGNEAAKLTELIIKLRNTEDINMQYTALEKQYRHEIDLLKLKYQGESKAALNTIVNKLKKDSTSNIYVIEKKLIALGAILIKTAQNTDSELAATARLKALVKEFDAVRVGFSWDVAGGVGLNFRDKRFDNSKLYNSGIWTTAGWNFEKTGSILGVARLMMNPDQIYALNNAANPFTDDLHTFDAGARYVYSKDKFSCSIEGIYRSIIKSSIAEPSWRVVFNTDYTIAPNQKLLFSFGRNFDGTLTKSNNLIASLSLLFGFGGTKLSQ